MNPHMTAFQFWSKTHSSINERLRPKLNDVNWDELSHDDKARIWQHLTNKGWFAANAVTLEAVYGLNETARKHSYGEHLLSHGGPHEYTKDYPPVTYYQQCCMDVARLDFERIFKYQPVDVVFELLSFFASGALSRKLEKEKDFDTFSDNLNDVFKQFGIGYRMSKSGFIPHQDSKITNSVWEPVIAALNDKKWTEVDRELSTAFTEYRKGDKSGYSAAVTHSVNAMQAYLQILVYGEVGKGRILELITEAEKKHLLPTKGIGNDLVREVENVLARERMKSGNAHPKKDYADETSALFVLNIVMISLQYFLSVSANSNDAVQRG